MSFIELVNDVVRTSVAKSFTYACINRCCSKLVCIIVVGVYMCINRHRCVHPSIGDDRFPSIHPGTTRSNQVQNRRIYTVVITHIISRAQATLHYPNQPN